MTKAPEHAGIIAAGIGTLATGDIIIVDPDKLVSTAEEVRSLSNKMKADFQEMDNIVSRTKSYWIGEAGDAQRIKYESNKENIAEMLRRLQEHPVDLLKISGNYKEAEKINVQTAQALSSNIC